MEGSGWGGCMVLQGCELQRKKGRSREDEWERVEEACFLYSQQPPPPPPPLSPSSGGLQHAHPLASGAGRAEGGEVWQVWGGMSRERSRWEGMMGGCHVRCRAEMCIHLNTHTGAQKIGSSDARRGRMPAKAPFSTPGILRGLRVRSCRRSWRWEEKQDLGFCNPGTLSTVEFKWSIIKKKKRLLWQCLQMWRRFTDPFFKNTLWSSAAGLLEVFPNKCKKRKSGMQLLSIKPQSYETHNHRGGSLLKILKKTYKTDLFSFVFNKVWLLIKAWISLLCFVSHKRTPALLFFIFSLNASCLLCLNLVFIAIIHLCFYFPPCVPLLFSSLLSS